MVIGHRDDLWHIGIWHYKTFGFDTLQSVWFSDVTIYLWSLDNYSFMRSAVTIEMTWLAWVATMMYNYQWCTIISDVQWSVMSSVQQVMSSVQWYAVIVQWFYLKMEGWEVLGNRTWHDIHIHYNLFIFIKSKGDQF